ncbi:MAG: sulfatase-like hydrolase/transferase, partial [Defluviitaleaceae bacterium]|nr:sulfatase-like hydrolase/transferase [Defluviitaleaceae bacterium]
TISFDEPHHPYLCPQPYSAMYKDYFFPKSPNIWDSLENKPDYQRVWAADSLKEDKDALQISEPYYFGCNSYADHLIGEIVNAAEANAPNAIIIYTSDHGDFLHSHSLGCKGPAAYDEITRVPFIVAGRGIPKGFVSENPVSHINITPTVTELMGLPLSKTFEGKSIASELRDPDIRTNDHVFIEFGRYEVDHDSFGGLQLMRTVFDGRCKLTVNLLSGDELYDMENDPHEMENLISNANYKLIRDALHDRLIKHMDETRDPFRGYYWVDRPWRTDAPARSWMNSSHSRQREEDERYQKRLLDYDTGMPIEQAVKLKHDTGISLKIIRADGQIY